jgi:hypothetical protein
MDPKLSNIDPKLAEAYNRVMNTSSAPGSSQNPQIPSPYPTPPAPQTPPPQSQQPYQQVPPAPVEPQLPPQPIQNQQPQAPFPVQPIPVTNTAPVQTFVAGAAPVQTTPATSPVSHNFSSNNLPGVDSTVAFNAKDENKNQGTTSPVKKKSRLIPLAVALGIVLMLTVYTFVWIMVFNVQIPFMPQV